MKNFKFRAWDKDHKYMEYTNKNLILTFGEKGNVNATDLSDIYSACEYMQNYELMQSTGLKDKNGTEIYEGDIVSANHPRLGEFIGFVDNAIGNFKVRGVGQYEYLSDDLDGTYEVIGNIYENPELLEDD